MARRMKYIWMKLSICLCCLLLLGIQNRLHARQSNDTMITIAQASIDITQLARIIAAQTGLKYSLNMQNESLKRKIQLRPGKYRLTNVLEEVSRQARLRYKVIGNHILFIAPQPSAQSKPQPLDMATKNKVAPARKQFTIIQQPGTSDSRDLQPSMPRLTVIKDSAHKTSIPFPATIPFRPLKTKRKRIPNIYSLQDQQSVGLPDDSDKEPLVSVSVLLAADEVFYVNASLQAGFKYLYGIASYGASFKVAGLRWGAGVPVALGNENKLHLQFTTGHLQKYYELDTFKNKMRIKERLNRLALGWSKDFNQHFGMQVLVHYNWLRKKVSENQAGVVPPLTPAFDQKYFIIKPPYTIQNLVKDTYLQKSWVGLQGTFFYRLF